MNSACAGCKEKGSLWWPQVKFDHELQEIQVVAVKPLCQECASVLDLQKQSARVVNHTLAIENNADSFSRYLAVCGTDRADAQHVYDSVSKSLLLYREVKPVKWTVASSDVQFN